MSQPLGGPSRPRTDRDLWSILIGAAILIATGIVFGMQYVNPDKRVLSVIAGIVVVGIAWRLDVVSGIGLLVLVIPYPRSTVFGSTNLAFILLLTILWLLRVAQGMAAAPRRTPVDVPILTLAIAFVISFYNVQAPDVGYALSNFAVLAASMALFYLIVHNVRTTRDLERVHLFQAISLTTICLVALFELNHPGGALIPGWIDFSTTHGEALDTRNIRVGGPFFDFELLSEYCAISIPFVLFLLVRARSGAWRVVYGGLLLMVAFIQFATVTRGGIISLMVGLLFMVWTVRRRIQFVSLVIWGTVAVLLFFGMNFYVAHFTRSGDLLKRLLNPATLEFQNGLPINRAELWHQAFERMLQHPFIGHGPYYSIARGLTFWYWPHNAYLLVANFVGIIGLSAYLWWLVRTWRITTPVRSDLQDPDYARGFLVVAHVQLFIFLVDQLKIDWIRNQTYTFTLFGILGVMTATALIVRREAESADARRD